MDRAPSTVSPVSFHPRSGDRALAARLRREIEGEVLFDPASRGRYSTDASIYQIDPVGVVVPKTEQDAKIALRIAVEEGVPVLPRGAGSSQCGQTVGAALVIDHSKFLNTIVSFDKEAATAVVQPGVVLDSLNAQLRRHGLWFPVDVSTSAQATLGGMAGNNSCGSRSIRYGNMVHNVLGIEALLADGSEHHFGAVPADISRLSGEARYVELAKKVSAIAEREAGEIEARWPKVLRRVQGYNLDFVKPRGEWNFAQLLVGSEGTLAYSKRIHLKLSPLPRFRTLGVCHFRTFRQSMEAPQHIVDLAPTAVELVDRTMIGLARGNPAYRSIVEKFVRGDPDAILVVEFVGDDRDGPAEKLERLSALMADLGHPDSVIRITDAALQREVWEVRKAGLNIMMSMKGDGKPVSFIKDLFDPKGLLNPGKIVRPSKQDDRTLFRFKPEYAAEPLDTVLDWSEWSVPGAASQGFAAAVEMCNNNGHCRKFDAGTMCPSFRATGDEKHLTRGRANSLRLALSGQLGPEAFTSDEMFETLDLCVSCKGCRRECPTGVDMAKMKIEFLHHYHARHGYSLKDKLIAYLPHYAPWAARFAPLANAIQEAGKRWLGFARERSLPRWRRDAFLSSLRKWSSAGKAGEIVLLVDTFNDYFEPENAQAALAVLDRAGYGVRVARAHDADTRPLCCGRTFLAVGMVDEARVEARRVIAALKPYVARGIPVIGLEPSCLLTLRDEFKAILPGRETEALSAQALLFEEFLAREREAGRLALELKPLPGKRALVHGHCHQKAFGAMPAVHQVLALVPELKVEAIESSCCGMAGSFGYEASHYEVSMKMAELALLPRVRSAGADAIIVADGTSCRHQIADGTTRQAVHVAQVLARALA